MKTLTQIIDEGIEVKRDAIKVIVTPQCATRALSLNVNNRIISQAWADELSARQQDGRWDDDHPHGIVFSDSRLIDGQHRLLAVQKSGENVVMRVDTGVRDGLREFINDGPSRKACDRLTFNSDRTKNKRLVEILTAWCRIHYPGNVAKQVPTNAITRAWEEIGQYAESVVEQTYAAYASKVCRGTVRAPVMCAVCELMRHDMDLGLRFLDSVRFPDGPVQPARILREWLIRTTGTSFGRVSHQRQDYQHSIAAVRAAVEGREIKLIRTSAELLIGDLYARKAKTMQGGE